MGDTANPLWLAVLGGILSAVPLFLILRSAAVHSYNAVGDFFHRLMRHKAPGPAVILGLLGGALSVGLTILIKRFFFKDDPFVRMTGDPVNWAAEVAFLYAGLAEEAAKCAVALALLGVVALKRESDGLRRWMVLGSAPFVAGSVGLGFALLENVDYMRAGGQGVASLFIARSLFAATVHTVIGFNFGLTMLSDGVLRLRNALTGLLIAVLWHGLYDFFAIPSGTLSHFISGSFLVLIAAYTALRARSLLPVPAFLPVRERRLHAAVVSGASGPARPATSSAQRVGLGRQAAGERFFVREFVADPHRNVRPPLASMPFSPDEFPFGGETVRKALLAPEYRGPVPVDDQPRWEAWERAVSRAVTLSSSDGSVWDTSIFADLVDEDPETYQTLSRAGIDLLELSPLRVIEHGPGPGRPFYTYVTCGLTGLECWITFPHPFPLVRWLFVQMSLLHPVDPMLAPGVRGGWEPFEPILLDSRSLGDPRGWFKAILPVPLLDPAGPLLLNEVGIQGLPMELLYLSGHDVEFIREKGLRAYFDTLKAWNVSWMNDFRRKAVF
ncbi:MAG: PrsW family intramembrane metalloprotease [Spirochaetia bacterium]|nr:PrsW family intramembrane metalloprotease [Spirochaetia bacterium]